MSNPIELTNEEEEPPSHNGAALDVAQGAQAIGGLIHAQPPALVAGGQVTDRRLPLFLPEPHSRLRIAIIANLKNNVALDSEAPPDALAEYDYLETVQSIAQVYQSAGHETFILEANKTLLDTVRQTNPDICFNFSEGLRGEAREAHVPALLEMLGIPYTGSNVLTSAIALNKSMAKCVWRQHGLPTPDFQVFHSGDEAVKAELSFPLFVKPLREGSGKGVNPLSIVHDEAHLREQARWLIKTYRQPALVEAYLPGREFTVGLIGNTRTSSQPLRSPVYNERGFHVFPIEEVDTANTNSPGAYGISCKSVDMGDKNCPIITIPASIPQALEMEIKQLAMDAFEALGCFDIARVDFRLDAAGRPNLVEINQVPGLRPHQSDLCLSADAEGFPYETLVSEVLNLALERYGLLHYVRKPIPIRIGEPQQRRREEVVRR
jgi:D-alanine-D-alanine ligase